MSYTQGVSKKLQDKEMEKVEHNRFYSIKFSGKISIFQENWGQPGCFAYNYFPQLLLLTEIYIVKLYDKHLKFEISIICMYIYLYAGKPKNWPYISHSIVRVMESNYMQNDRAALNFLGTYIFFVGT